MKTMLPAALALFLVTLAASAFAADAGTAPTSAPAASPAPTMSPASPASPAASLPTLGQPARISLAGPVCNGNCEIHCASGAEDFYYTTSNRCCIMADGLCKDGSDATYGEWLPVSCGVAVICS